MVAWTVCFYAPKPDELAETGLYTSMAKLNLIELQNTKGAKDASGKSCATSVHIQPTPLFYNVQSYYYDYLHNLFTSG